MKALVVIPTYNEKENISRLIRRILNVNPFLEILVVDDSSPDGTAKQVEEDFRYQSRVHLLVRSRKSGLGPAYIAGFKWGLARDYEAMIEMDADLSHRPRYLVKFLEEIRNVDVVIGSRWVPGGKIVNWPRRRVLLSRLANVYSKWVLGVEMNDLTAGFICYRRQVLETLGLERIHSDGYGFQIEMKYRAFKNGFHWKEIPITFTDRKAGDSKISRRIVFEAVWMVWRLRFQNKRLRKSAKTNAAQEAAELSYRR